MKINAGPIVYFFLILFLLPSSLRADFQVKIGVYQNEPLIFVDSDGTSKGLFADILEYIADQEWVKREKLVAFAGHPLIVENNVVGVIAIFSKKQLSAAAMKVLSSVSDQIALGIEHKQAEEALRESEEQYRDILKMPTN